MSEVIFQVGNFESYYGPVVRFTFNSSENESPTSITAYLRDGRRVVYVPLKSAPGDATLLCPAGCDCSCCYGYTDKDCHCFEDVCNCGASRAEHGGSRRANVR